MIRLLHKNSHACLILVGLFLSLILLSSNVHAQEEKAAKGIAIVDIQSLLQNSKAAVSIQEQLKEQRKSFQSEFSKFEKELQSAEKNLAEQRSELSAEEFSAKRDDFEDQLVKTRSIVQKRKNALDEALKKAMKELRVEILNIVADIADDKNYDLVLSRQNVIIVDKGIDITKDVLTRLDKSLKSVDLDIKLK